MSISTIKSLNGYTKPLKKKIENAFHNCFTFSVPEKAIDRNIFDKNSYVFYICYIECIGLKQKKEMMYLVCSPEDLIIKSSDKGEKLVVESLFEGIPVTDLRQRLSKIDSRSIDTALEICKSEFKSRFNNIEKEMQDNNDAIYYRMMAKTKSFYDSKIENLERGIRENEDKCSEQSVHVAARIMAECGCWFEPEDLKEKIGAILELKKQKTKSESATTSKLYGLEETKLASLSDITFQELSNLQNTIRTTKGLRTKTMNIKKQLENSIFEIDGKREMDISYKELCGGIIFIS